MAWGPGRIDDRFESGMRSTPSGNDTLEVRRAYLRRRRSRQPGAWHRTAVSVVLGATACCVCMAGFAVFVFGS
jgi:hypothetical protein